jgi:cysteine desulfurase family protein (TIGR01976 family)
MEKPMPLDLTAIRSQFPGLQRPAIFLDNPGGTQIAQASLDRVNSYLVQHNANHGGAFVTSQESDAILEEAHTAMADFYNATRPEEIIFGNNMTTLTLHISRSIARTWNSGDTIVVTRLDHDANITPWVLAAKDRGVNVRWVDFHVEDGTLDLEDLQQALESKPRLLAVGYASNALGTINPVAKIVEMAHAAGALVYIDSVQYAAHGPIDVQKIGCDFLVTSAYKFFGTHVGALYGKYDLLDELTAYKVRPAPNDLPDKFETGTQNHEGIAGVLGALEYLEWLGRTFGGDYAEKYTSRGKSVDDAATTTHGTDLPLQGRRLHLKQALSAIRAYEFEISRAVLDVLEETPGVIIYGLTDRRRLEERVPTVSFTLKVGAGVVTRPVHPLKVAQALNEETIYVWDGNYYALAITERLGLEDSGGMVRVGPVHYNTVEEVHKFGEALGRISTEKK